MPAIAGALIGLPLRLAGGAVARRPLTLLRISNSPPAVISRNSNARSLVNPFEESCSRVDEEDSSVEENAYMGPLWLMVVPIRTEPIASDRCSDPGP